MEAYNNDDSNKNVDMMEVKSEKNERLSSGKTDDSLLKIYKLKASSKVYLQRMW